MSALRAGDWVGIEVYGCQGQVLDASPKHARVRWTSGWITIERLGFWDLRRIDTHRDRFIIRTTLIAMVWIWLQLFILHPPTAVLILLLKLCEKWL